MSAYDLVVIGSGPAGQRAAIAAAKLGRKVAVVERHPDVGGGCIHRGTIPSKTLREVVAYLSGIRQRHIYGPTWSRRSTSSRHSGAGARSASWSTAASRWRQLTRHSPPPRSAAHFAQPVVP